MTPLDFLENLVKEDLNINEAVALLHVSYEKERNKRVRSRINKRLNKCVDTITTTIDGLKARGLLIDLPHPIEDARLKPLQLTSEGEELISRVLSDE